MKEIAPQVYQIALFPRNAVNCYVAGDVLIDAGIRSSAARILRALGSHRLTQHALTHAHADHQGSSRQICETLGIPLCTSAPEQANAESGYVIRDYPGAGLIPRLQQRYWAGPGYPVTKLLREGDRLGDFTVIETPGHAPGHLSFFREHDGVLIVGDTLVNMNLLTTVSGLREPPRQFTADVARNRASIRKLYDLKPRILCFGHGPVLYDRGEFAAFMRRF